MKAIIIILLLLFIISPLSSATTLIDFPEKYQDYQGYWHKYTGLNLVYFPMYSQNDDGANHVFSTFGDTVKIPKTMNVTLTERRISPSLTFPKTQLASRMVNYNTTVAYLVFPYSLSRVKDYSDEHNIKLGRWSFDTAISIQDSNKTLLNPSFYDFKIVNDEIRLYFVKSEANKLFGDITFQMNSWTIDNSTTSGFTSSNVSFDGVRWTDSGQIAINHKNDSQLNITGLVLYYSNDENTGTLVHNVNTESGLVNTTNQGTWNGNASVNYSNGKIGNALAFDGVDDYVDVGNDASLNFSGNHFSILYWFNSSDISSSQGTIVDKGFAEFITLGHYLSKLFFGYPSSTNFVSGVTIMESNTWYSSGFVWDGTNITMYLNGQLDKTQTITLPTDQSIQWRIGGNSWGGYYTGKLDEVRIYNRALSANEISVLYNTSLRSQGNLTILNQSASAGNVINRTRIVYSGQDSINNISLDATQNGTSTWFTVQENMTSNTWYPITNQFNNMDFRIRLNSNGSNTPFFTSLEWDETFSVPTATLLDYYGLNSNGSKITTFNTTNLQYIEKMVLNFSISSGLDINSWYFNFTANGTRGCSLGNKQSSRCYNHSNDDPYKWIQFINNTNTETFNGLNMNTGDYIQASQSGSGNMIYVNLTIDEHYNPNVFKWYDALFNFSNVKWQTGVNQRITKNNLIKVAINNTIVPMDADQYKLDFRVNYSQTPKIPTYRIRAFACSHNYTTGNPDASPHCAIVGAKYPSELQDDGTKFRAIFTKNLIDQIGDIDSIILATAEPNPTQYYYINTYKADAPAYTTNWEYSNDLGESWTNLGDGYETELNINWFYDGLESDTITAFIYQMYANTSVTSNTTLGEIAWDINATRNYPPLVNIMTPLADENITLPYNVTFDIADPNNDELNVSLILYQNGIYNQTLITNMTNYSYVMDGISPGDYQLYLFANETNTTELYSVSSIRNFTIIPTWDISGYVFNILEVPLQNARVDVGTQYNFTDANGYYNISSIHEGTYTVLARAIGYSDSSDTTTLNSNTVMNFTLLEPAGIDNTEDIQAIIGLVAVLIALVIVSRKQKKKKV